jgi:hypothetical protein
MRAQKNKALNAELYARLQQLPLTQAERGQAVSALQKADALVDAIIWACQRIQGLYARATSKKAHATPAQPF